MAVIDRQALENSELRSGDFVRVQGRDRDQSVIARAWPSDGEDVGSDSELEDVALVIAQFKAALGERDTETEGE